MLNVPSLDLVGQRSRSFGSYSTKPNFIIVKCNANTCVQKRVIIGANKSEH